MALETASFPNQLVATNPTGGDAKGQGDDHIRLLKQVIKNTFPNITGAITVTQAQINQLAAPDLFVQPGMIVMWSGSLSSLPTGWLLCNGVGTITGGLSVPDLRDKFILGAGASAAVRSVGGPSTHTHGATVSITPTALDISQIPSHNHIIAYNEWTPDGVDTGPGTGMEFEPLGPVNYPGVFHRTSSSVGSGAPHGHTGSVSVPAASNIPPYYALGFIIKS